MPLQRLLELPAGFADAMECITALDRCFLLGFSRLGPEQHQALESLARTFAGSPLGERVGEAVEALKRNEFLEKHFTSIAAARAALQGAMYDALRAQVCEALRRTVPPTVVSTDKVEILAPLRSLQESTRHWLMEVTLAGFQQLEHATLAPFFATLEQVQNVPQLTRLAALLTGFLNELLAALPITAQQSLPIHRWVDLWTRGVVSSLHIAPTAGEKVSGKLSILGVDLRHHGYFVSADVYSLLNANKQSRVVRTTLSAYKVDVLAGREMWKCFGPKVETLLRAISQELVLDVKDMTLLPTNDLVWDGKATAGKEYNRAELAAEFLSPGAEEEATFPRVAPVDRHPVQIAELVYLEEISVDGEPPAINLGDGKGLPVAMERLSPASEIEPEDVAGATAMLGLLRFDGGRWLIQPLAVSANEREVFTGQSAYESLKFTINPKKGDTLEILQERASRLLRKKS